MIIDNNCVNANELFAFYEERFGKSCKEDFIRDFKCETSGVVPYVLTEDRSKMSEYQQHFFEIFIERGIFPPAIVEIYYDFTDPKNE